MCKGVFVCMYTWVECPVEARRSYQMPWIWSYRQGLSHLPWELNWTQALSKSSRYPLSATESSLQPMQSFLKGDSKKEIKPDWKITILPSPSSARQSEAPMSQHTGGLTQRGAKATQHSCVQHSAVPFIICPIFLVSTTAGQNLEKSQLTKYMFNFFIHETGAVS